MTVRGKLGRPVRRHTSRPWGRAACTAAVAAVASAAVISGAQATPLHRTPRVVVFDAVTARPGYLKWKPASIVYSGDGAAFLAGTGSTFNHLVWTTWTSRQGIARGSDWHNDCVPACADGKDTGYPAIIRVYRPRHVGGYLLFTRITTTYTGAHPPYPGYRRRSITYRLRYAARYNSFFWSLP